MCCACAALVVPIIQRLDQPRRFPILPRVFYPCQRCQPPLATEHTPRSTRHGTRHYHHPAQWTGSITQRAPCVSARLSPHAGPAPCRSRYPCRPGPRALVLRHSSPGPQPPVSPPRNSIPQPTGPQWLHLWPTHHWSACHSTCRRFTRMKFLPHCRTGRTKHAPRRCAVRMLRHTPTEGQRWGICEQPGEDCFSTCILQLAGELSRAAVFQLFSSTAASSVLRCSAAQVSV